jgi:hypothetical protein
VLTAQKAARETATDAKGRVAALARRVSLAVAKDFTTTFEPSAGHTGDRSGGVSCEITTGTDASASGAMAVAILSWQGKVALFAGAPRRSTRIMGGHSDGRAVSYFVRLPN